MGAWSSCACAATICTIRACLVTGTVWSACLSTPPRLSTTPQLLVAGAWRRWHGSAHASRYQVVKTVNPRKIQQLAMSSGKPKCVVRQVDYAMARNEK